MNNDADVVRAPSDGRALSYRNVVYGALLVLVGLGGLIAGVALPQIVIGVIGFVLMLGGVVLAVTPSRHRLRGARDPRPVETARPSFMDKMNERWDRRGHDQQ